MRQNTQHKLAALVSVTFIMVFGNSMLIPLFPQIQTALDIPFAKVGLIITYYSIAAAVCIPIFGFISDHIKRKIIIIIALLLYGIGGSMIGVMVLFMGDGISFTHILVGRVIQGMGAAGMSPIALTLVGDLFLTEERAKALGYIESVNILGKVVSPILGTALAAIIWFAPFFMFGIFIIPVLPAVILLIHEPDHKSKTPLKKYFSDLKKLFCLHRNFIWVSYLGGAVSFFILFGLLTYLSDVAGDLLNVSGVMRGVIIAVPVSAWAISSVVSGYYLEKKPETIRYFILAGLLLFTCLLIFIPFISTLFIMIPATFLLGAGGGFIIPSLTILVTNCAPEEERGGIISLYGSVRFLGVAFGPLIFSYLVNIETLLPFWITAVVTFFIFVYFIFIKNQKVVDFVKQNNE